MFPDRIFTGNIYPENASLKMRFVDDPKRN
jgi:hypothetical protein